VKKVVKLFRKKSALSRENLCDAYASKYSCRLERFKLYSLNCCRRCCCCYLWLSSLCVVTQKTGRALQALQRITCLQRHSANNVHGAKSSVASSSGHGSVVSERSAGEIKDSDENDLSEVTSRSLAMTDSGPSSRDSGIDRSVSMYGQIMNDDACDGAKYQSDQKVELTTGSDGLSEAPFKPSSTPEEVYKSEAMENRMSASDSGIVGSNSVYRQTPSDDDDGDGGDDDVDCQGLTKQEVERLQKATSKARSLSEVCHSEKMVKRMSASDTGERSDDMNGSVATDDLDIEGQEVLVKPDVDACPAKSLTTTTTICEKVASTVASRTTVSEESSTSTPEISGSDDVGTGRCSTSTRICETVVSEVPSRDASTGERSSSTPVNTNVLPRTSFSVSTRETSFSTAGKPTPSETSLVNVAVSSSTVDKLECRTPQTTASTVFIRSTSSTSGNQEPPRRRVMNVEFLTESKSSKPKKPPMFVRKMKNVNVVEGETARFDVRVAGNPVPSLTWHKNGVELAIDSCKYSVEAMVEEGRWSLVICSCTKVDKAEYSCTAASDIGKITSRAQLVVEPTATGKH